MDLQDKITALQMLQFKCLYIGISLVVEERRLKTDSIIHASISSTCFAMFEEANVKRSFYKQAFLSQSTVCLPVTCGAGFFSANSKLLI